MKKSELKKLVSEYNDLRLKLTRRDSANRGPVEKKLGEMKHRYFHETGNDIDSDSKLGAGEKQ